MRFRLDKEERLFPRPNHSGQNHQKHPVPLARDGSFDLPTQDDQLVPYQGVFRSQFSFASGQVSECSQGKGSSGWFEPRQNIFLQLVQAETDSLLH
jgi:hypothetical protein